MVDFVYHPTDLFFFWISLPSLHYHINLSLSTISWLFYGGLNFFFLYFYVKSNIFCFLFSFLWTIFWWTFWNFPKFIGNFIANEITSWFFSFSNCFSVLSICFHCIYSRLFNTIKNFQLFLRLKFLLVSWPRFLLKFLPKHKNP